MSYFWSPNKKEKREEEEEEEQSDQAKVWIHDFCKDIWSLVWNSKILSKNFLSMDC